MFPSLLALCYNYDRILLRFFNGRWHIIWYSFLLQRNTNLLHFWLINHSNIYALKPKPFPPAGDIGGGLTQSQSQSAMFSLVHRLGFAHFHPSASLLHFLDAPANPLHMFELTLGVQIPRRVTPIYLALTFPWLDGQGSSTHASPVAHTIWSSRLKSQVGRCRGFLILGGAFPGGGAVVIWVVTALPSSLLVSPLLSWGIFRGWDMPTATSQPPCWGNDKIGLTCKRNKTKVGITMNFLMIVRCLIFDLVFGSSSKGEEIQIYVSLLNPVTSVINQPNITTQLNSPIL